MTLEVCDLLGQGIAPTEKEMLEQIAFQVGRGTLQISSTVPGIISSLRETDYSEAITEITNYAEVVYRVGRKIGCTGTVFIVEHNQQTVFLAPYTDWVVQYILRAVKFSVFLK
jgi:hypothetical protein